VGTASVVSGLLPWSIRTWEIVSPLTTEVSMGRIANFDDQNRTPPMVSDMVQGVITDNGPEPPEVGLMETTGRHHQNSTTTHQPTVDITDRATKKRRDRRGSRDCGGDQRLFLRGHPQWRGRFRRDIRGNIPDNRLDTRRLEQMSLIQLQLAR